LVTFSTNECGFRTSDSWIWTVIRMSPKLNSLVPGPCPMPLQEILPKSVHNFFSYRTSHLTNSFCQNKHGYLAANSNYHYLKHFLPISITCKFHTFHNYLPVNSFTCKFHRATFTAKFHCLQIPTIRLYRQSPLHANSETADLLQKSITCRFNYLQIHTTPNEWTFISGIVGACVAHNTDTNTQNRHNLLRLQNNLWW